MDLERERADLAAIATAKGAVEYRARSTGGDTDQDGSGGLKGTGCVRGICRGLQPALPIAWRFVPGRS